MALARINTLDPEDGQIQDHYIGIPASEEKKTSPDRCCSSLRNNTKLLHDINLSGTVCIVIDAAIGMLGYADHFRGWVGGCFYTIPSLFTGVPTLFSRCCKRQEVKLIQPNDDVIKQIDRLCKKDSVFAEIFDTANDTNPKALRERELVLKVIRDSNESNPRSTQETPPLLDSLLNLSFLFLRSIRGALCILEYYKIANRELNDNFNAVADYIFNVLSYGSLTVVTIRYYLSYRNRNERAQPLPEDAPEQITDSTVRQLS